MPSRSRLCVCRIFVDDLFDSDKDSFLLSILSYGIKTRRILFDLEITEESGKESF